MKLWLVINILGHVAGSAGPLPYDINECHSRAAELQAECHDNAKVPFKCTDMAFTCEWHDARPADESAAIP